MKRNTIQATNLLIFLFALISPETFCQQPTKPFPWPEAKQAAISLSFDDARASQVNGGTALLDKYGVKATFYLVPAAVKSQLSGWKKAVASGHEIGNHSLNHPCSGNFVWSRSKALEEYTLGKMEEELVEANKQIKEMLGVDCKVFAYPCGQTFVGRGEGTQSYVPITAKLFDNSRGWMDEAANDPSYVDFAQLTGVESDGKDFDKILLLIEQAKKSGQWLVLAGHEMGEGGDQTTRLAMLEELMKYAADPANGIWLAPVGTVADYVSSKR
ncbi:polysaccharide deacetylase family protein [uncultured Imperialibacter sp.]|uniref:polysaccharide deacetylase family protein n=1 Tax=uncultured Imperialibacter sp. TaxID=1672639 RepID=UPI0030DB7788|tara:strand:- start:4191 stop:5003 length:813 start_codon:yes stop_codon:yes gene_type:complete